MNISPTLFESHESKNPIKPKINHFIGIQRKRWTVIRQTKIPVITNLAVQAIFLTFESEAPMISEGLLRYSTRSIQVTISLEITHLTREYCTEANEMA